MMTDNSSSKHQNMKGRRPQEGEEEEAKAEHQTEPRRLCDYCNDARALLYCRADSAKLCLSCDREVHATNQLFTKHTRSLLCDACDASPASISCETEHSVLCQNCDWEKHNSLSTSSLHDRRPIEGFGGCPSVSELMSNLGLDDLGIKKALFLNEECDSLVVGSEADGSGLEDGYSDLLVWETPAVVSIDDLIVSSDTGQTFQALGVPPLPKNRNAACGQQKEEIIRQLRELARLEPVSNYGYADSEPVDIFQSLAAEQSLQPQDSQSISFPDYRENMLHWFNDTGEAANQPFNQPFLPSTLMKSNFEENSTIPDKDCNIGGSISHANDGHEAQPQHLHAARMLSVYPKVVAHEYNSQERDSAISRYKEKKKTRRYEKQIRYESRKARAESRTRIKGRFAKMDH